MKTRQRIRPRVLALHGVAATPALWDDVSREAPECEILAPDLTALSHAVGGRLGSLVRALAAMVPTGTITLTGCDVGANIALELAPLLGERLQGVLLVNPNPLNIDPVYRDRHRQLGRLLHMNMSMDEILAWTSLVVHRAGVRAQRAAAQATAMLRVAGGPPAAPLLQFAADFPDGRPALKRIRAPVRALLGAENLNPFLGPGWRDEWGRALGLDNVEALPETRMWVPIEAPEAVALALRGLAVERLPQHAEGI